MRLLGTLALLIALTGCGDDPVTTGSPEPETSAVTLVSGTAGRGELATRATDVTDDAALAAYVVQFDDSFGAEVIAAAGKVEVGDSEVLLAQVVSIGCDVPPSADLRGGVIVPAKLASPMMECFAPMTTVGLAAAPAKVAQP